MSFDAHKILVYAWPPTHRLPSARFSADLKQLQNRDFSTSNRSKPIRVLTRTKCSCSDDRLPISYSLPDFQQIWSNFLNHSRHFTQFNQEGRGSTRWGGCAPPNPPGGDRANRKKWGWYVVFFISFYQKISRFYFCSNIISYRRPAVYFEIQNTLISCRCPAD